MHLTYFISFIIIALIITENCFFVCGVSFLTCKRCTTQDECEQHPPDLCIWGETRNLCERRICSKGPGEMCGGPMKYLGDCGEGMICKSDNRCHGCSIQTMQCY